MPDRLRWLRGYCDRPDWRILAVVVTTVICCASVLISAPIDPSSYARSLVSDQPTVSSTPPLRVNASTPASALESWFEAVRAADVPAVLRLTTARAQRAVGRKALGDAVDIVAGALGRPSIVQVERHGTRATVRLLVLGYAGTSRLPVSAAPLLVELSRGPGGWQIADVNYLMSSTRTIRSLPRAGG